MSMPLDILEKFQYNLDLFGEALVERIQELLPDLSPEEQQDSPILMSDTVYSTVLFCPTLKYTTAEASYQGEGCVFKCDIVLANNNLTFNVGDYIGMTYDVSWAKDVSLENSNNNTIFFELAHEGDLSASLAWDGFTIKLYYEGAYHATDIRFKIDAPVTTRKLNLYLSAVRAGAEAIASYDVNSEIVTWTPNRNIKPQSGGQVFYSLASYPFISNIKDTTNINNWITNNGATNNYTSTYTTPDNKSITVYYGDNYIITHVNDDEPVSYNDVKNALNIAVNQINDDNDVDLNVPDYPIPPDPDPDIDDIDKQDMGVGTNLGGLGGYWLLTKGQLEDLHDALDSAPAGFDPLNSFISLMGLGVDASKVLDATQFQYVTPINIRMSDGTTWQTHVEAHIIGSNEIVSAFNSDVFRIQRKYNNFLDYSPYATHELFIPMCGWVTLPDIAVDRDIYVTYIPDIESCKCRAVVSVVSNSEGDNDACVIAEKDGIMGSDVPFSNVGHSLFVGDAIINGANVAGEVITGAIGAGFTKTNAKGGTYRPYEGFTVGMGGTLPSAIGNAFISGNINRTHFMTGNSTKTGFSNGESIIVKSVYHIPDMPDNYAHTVGLVCNKTGQLSEFNGFTVCDNPHITFSALEAEKEEIKRLLEEGVILPSGE